LRTEQLENLPPPVLRIHPQPEGILPHLSLQQYGQWFTKEVVRVIEVSEYATLRDCEQDSVHKIIEMFVQTLPKSAG
jgi:hypothetical protein